MTRQWAPEGRIRWCWLELGDDALMLQEYWRDGHRAGMPEGPLGQGIAICFIGHIRRQALNQAAASLEPNFPKRAEIEMVN